ncbi:MAG: hypothetical protein ACE5QF_04305 [Thermoplasmata archaeon]
MTPERKRRFPGPIKVAYILVVLGVALVPLGIGLTLVRVCEFDCTFMYMTQGLIAVGVGLFVLFFAILLFFVPTNQKREIPTTSQTYYCTRCGRPASWITPEKRWYCHFCQDYTAAPSAKEEQAQA